LTEFDYSYPGASANMYNFSASVSLESVTYNILRYAYETMVEMPGFEDWKYIPDERGRRIVPIYPVTNAGAELPETENPYRLYIVYDDFIKQRSGNMRYFYPLKGIQSRFKVTTDDYAATRLITSRLVEIIDREDAAAEEINNWMRQYYGGRQRFKLHCVNAYQTSYMKDATNLDDQRNIFSQDIIIKADYHMVEPRIWNPETESVQSVDNWNLH
jgi:hypothetical protein